MSGMVLSKSLILDLFCFVCNRSMVFLFTRSIPRFPQCGSMKKIEHQYNCCWGQYAWRYDMKTLFRLLAFLRRTNRSLDSPHNGPEIRSLDVSFDVSIEKRLNKESSCQRYNMAPMRRQPNGLELDLHTNNTTWYQLKNGIRSLQSDRWL